MKLLMLMAITIASFAVFVPTLNAQDINWATLSAEDVKAIRKIIADGQFEKARADEAEKQRDAWSSSASNWQKLYLQEKSRADGVQEKRITEVKDESADLTKANFELHAQHDADRREIGQLNAEVIRLKAGRKWYFAAGAVAGGAAGYYAGKNTSRIQTIFTSATGTFQSTAPQFGVRLKF